MRDSRLRSLARFHPYRSRSVAQNVPVANVKKLGELEGVTLEVGDGLKHDYLNMNKPGDKTSNTTIEHLMKAFVEPKLEAVLKA